MKSLSINRHTHQLQQHKHSLQINKSSSNDDSNHWTVQISEQWHIECTNRERNTDTVCVYICVSGNGTRMTSSNSWMQCTAQLHRPKFIPLNAPYRPIHQRHCVQSFFFKHRFNNSQHCCSYRCSPEISSWLCLHWCQASAFVLCECFVALKPISTNSITALLSIRCVLAHLCMNAIWHWAHNLFLYACAYIHFTLVCVIEMGWKCVQ